MVEFEATVAINSIAQNAEVAGDESVRSSLDIAYSMGGGLSSEEKQAILDCFAHVAWVDPDGADYYQALYDLFFPPAELVRISAVYTQSGTVYPTTSLDSLKSDLVVKAHYSDGSAVTLSSSDYTLSGTLSVGTSTVAVSYSGKNTSFTVTVSAVPTLSSITAVYTQSGTVYDTDTLDSLKADLVVTAIYSDSSEETVPSTDYTLSGTLEVGTSTVTVTYEGKTDTFTVTVTSSSRWENDQITLTEADGEIVQGSVSTAAPYIGSYNYNKRVSYVGLDVTVSTAYTYKVEYTTTLGVTTGIGVQNLSTTAVEKVRASETLASGDKGDSGWKTSGYVFTPSATDAALWFTFHRGNEGNILPEEFPSITITRTAV